MVRLLVACFLACFPACAGETTRGGRLFPLYNSIARKKDFKTSVYVERSINSTKTHGVVRVACQNRNQVDIQLILSSELISQSWFNRAIGIEN
jgi:hypothetical protein